SRRSGSLAPSRLTLRTPLNQPIWPRPARMAHARADHKAKARAPDAACAHRASRHAGLDRINEQQATNAWALRARAISKLPRRITHAARITSCALRRAVVSLQAFGDAGEGAVHGCDLRQRLGIDPQRLRSLRQGLLVMGIRGGIMLADKLFKVLVLRQNPRIGGLAVFQGFTLQGEETAVATAGHQQSKRENNEDDGVEPKERQVVPKELPD